MTDNFKKKKKKKFGTCAFFAVWNSTAEGGAGATSTDLAVQSAPAGEHGVLAEARGRPRLPAPPGGRVEHLQLRVAQRPVDAHARGLARLLPAVGAADPCIWGGGGGQRRV